MKKYLLFFVLFNCLAFSALLAQNNTDGKLLTVGELETEIWYTSIEEGMKNPEKVYKLDLTRKKLKSFPLEILLFKNLQYLNLSSNKIDTLPVEIRAFQKLQVLNLYSNRLTKLPEEIGDLRNLKVLFLSKNLLYTFPVAIRGLQNLEKMDITYNNFTENEVKYARKYLPKNCEVIYD